MLSGYTQVITLLTAINEGQIFRYITKPWRLGEDFKPQIRAALEYYDQVNAVKAGDPEAALKSV